MYRACLLALALVASDAHAGGGAYGGLFAGYYAIGPDDAINGDFTVVPRVGYRFNDLVMVEAESGFVQSTTRIQGYVYDGLSPRLNAVVFLPKFGDFEPFVAAGPGVFYRNVHRESVGQSSNEDGWGNYRNPDVDFLANVGPGVMYRLGDLVVVRADLRGVLTAGTEPLGERPDRFSAMEFTVGVGFGAGPAPKDTDGDGILDKVDECVDDPEDFDHYKDDDGCPERDNDKDGITDEKDKCPDDPEDRDGFADKDGCPEPDNDRDTVLDVEDDCPNEYGDPENNGCPRFDEPLPERSDRDADGLYDDEDACPDDPGPRETLGCPDRDDDRVPDFRDECPDVAGDPRADPATSNGCPSRVVVTREKIVILEKVFFEFNKAIIKKESYSLLDEVAQVLFDHPEIVRIEVAGHTDADGNDAYNLKLSQARAESVRNYLIAAGVEEVRLTARGYGETVPIDSNGTDAGKANNRRVEFVIIERD